MNQMCVELSIIFVNWNSVQYLERSIASVHRHTRDISFEVIVVDNASPTGDADVIEKMPAVVTLVRSSKNLGFAGANNLGYKHSHGKYLLFLNPDTELLNSAVNEMLQRVKALEDAGVVGCKLLNSDLSVQTSCIQKFPTILNLALEAEFLRLRFPNCPLWEIGPLFSSNKEPVSVEVISGACMMVKREVFEAIGMFSESYFMYAEDLDLCYKSKAAGFANYYVGSGTVLHHGGKSSDPVRSTTMQWNALLLYVQKWRGAFYAFLFRIILSVVALGRLATISILALFGSTFADKGVLQRASAKWRSILNTLVIQRASLTGSHPVETAS